MKYTVLTTDAPVKKLVSIFGKASCICDKCGTLLKRSNWRNYNVVLSTSKSWETGFLCVRCMDKSALSLDRYVKKQKKEDKKPRVLKITRRLSYKCTRRQHEYCKSIFIHCTCQCHKERKSNVQKLS